MIKEINMIIPAGYKKVEFKQPPVWHSNGNWGGYYRDWLLSEDKTHYLSIEDNKKYIVICHGMGHFERIIYKGDKK